MTLAAYLFAPDRFDPSERESWWTLGRTHDASGEHTSADTELVTRIRNGDELAFRDVYLANCTILRDVARSIVRTNAVAEDVVQQVFIEVWMRRAEWQPRHLRPALIRAVRYRALDHWRQARHFEPLDTVRSFTTERTGIEDAEHHELEGALARALAQLPERRRTALLLRAVQQLSYAEIGAALDISEKAAFILVSRARTALEPIRQQFRDAV